MDPDEFIRGLVSVGLVLTMSLGASCQGASGSIDPPAAQDATRAAAEPLPLPTDPLTVAG